MQQILDAWRDGQAVIVRAHDGNIANEECSNEKQVTKEEYVKEIPRNGSKEENYADDECGKGKKHPEEELTQENNANEETSEIGYQEEQQSSVKREPHVPIFKIKEKVVRQRPERKTAAGLKRKLSNSHERKTPVPNKQARENDQEDICNSYSKAVTDTLMHKFLMACSQEDLKILYCHAEKSPFMKTNTFLTLDTSKLENDPIQSLELDLELKDHEDLIDDTTWSLNQRFDEISGAKNSKRRNDIIHVMALVITFAYVYKIPLPQALLTTMKVPQTLNGLQVPSGWPSVSTGKTYRIAGDNNLNPKEFNILQKGQMLNDRVNKLF